MDHDLKVKFEVAATGGITASAHVDMLMIKAAASAIAAVPNADGDSAMHEARKIHAAFTAMSRVVREQAAEFMKNTQMRRLPAPEDAPTYSRDQPADARPETTIDDGAEPDAPGLNDDPMAAERLIKFVE
jgi:hypothetical protein